jgi:hypothetical protein
MKDVEELMAQTMSDLEDLREKSSVLRLQYAEKEEVIRRKILRLDQQWVIKRSSFKLHEYTDAMEKLQGGKKFVPVRITAKQAELCQKLHTIEVMEQELDRLKDQNVEILRLMSQQIKEQTQNKDQMELDFMNKLCSAEADLDSIKQNRNKHIEKSASSDLEEKRSTTTDTSSSDDSFSEVDEEPLNSDSDRSSSLFGAITSRLGSRFSFRSSSSSSSTKTGSVPVIKGTPTRNPSCSFSLPPPRSLSIRTCDRRALVDEMTSPTN